MATESELQSIQDEETRLLRVWTPVILRAVLIAAVTVLIIGLLESTFGSPGHFATRFHELQRGINLRQPKDFALLVGDAIGGDGHSIMTLGLMLLTMVPIARVTFTLLVFLREKDYPYVAMTGYVLAALILGAESPLERQNRLKGYENQHGRFQERKWNRGLITGGGSGIGRATAQRLAKEGASIVIADLDEKMGAESVKLVEGAGGRATFVRADVTKESDARAMLDAAVSKFGRVDILHNNAGIAVGPPGFPAAEAARWRLVLDIDLYAVVLGCWLAAPIMTRAGGGAIVNTASMAGLYPHPLDPIYAAAKAAVVNFTYSLAPWASERKIRVNCVCPGITDTPMVRRGIEAATAVGMKSWLPSKIIQPEEIADAVFTLIRDDSLFGRALEVRPTGRRLTEIPGAPRAKS